MIKLKKLRFNGIGRFVKEQEIDFTNRDKLIQIDGKNNNTGGSSGAGKSTVFYALGYLLGINDVSAKDLQSRVGGKLSVEGDFEIDEVAVTITRSAKDGLTLKIGEESVSGNVKLAEERLQELIGIPEKLFKKMIHKKQKEGGFFLKMTSGEMFKFLIKILNLEHYTDKISKIDKNITEIENNIKNQNVTRDNLSSSIAESQKILETLVKPIQPETIIDVDSYKGRMQSMIDQGNYIHQQIEDLRKEQDSAIASIPVPVKPSTQLDLSGIEALQARLSKFKEEKTSAENILNQSKKETQKKINEANTAIYAIGTAKRDLAILIDQIKVLKAEAEHIQSAKCPKCSQTWVGDAATVEVAKIDQKMKDNAEKAWRLKTEIDKEPQFAEALQMFSNALKDFEADQSVKSYDKDISETTTKLAEEQFKIDNYVTNVNREFASKMTEYQNQTMTVKAEFTAKINDLNKQESQIASDIQLMKSQIASEEARAANFKVQMDNYDKSVKTVQAAIADKQQKFDGMEDTIAKYKKDLRIAEETKRLIKNYTLQIFQESLDYIGEQATEILSKIPNMSTASIYFEGCRETGKGILKDEVNAILNMDGHNEINMKTLSGGEETAAELAVDLAVIEMIENKVGKGADFFILDEPFTGLEPVNIQNTMDMLLEFNSNKKIIIVDHNPEVKAMVNDKITVVRTGEESEIQQ